MKNYEDFTKFEQEFDEFISGMTSSIQNFKVGIEESGHAQRVIELINECMQHSSKSRTIPYWIINEAFHKGMDIIKRYDRSRCEDSFYDYSPTFWKTIRESMEEELDTYYDDDDECENDNYIADPLER